MNFETKPLIWHVFHFMFYVVHLAILNIIRVLKINLQQSFLPAFLYPPLQTIKLGRP